MVQQKDLRGHAWAYIPIVVDESPMIIWDRAGSRTQVEFLEGIDPTYFQYLTNMHLPQLEGDDRLRAAIALRVTYSHALESLYACIGAALQARSCPAGWLLNYKNTELENLIRKITEREQFHNTLELKNVGWREVADTLLPLSTVDDCMIEFRRASTRLWKALAHDFLEDNLTNEYNSLKHGFRIRPGPWAFSIGAEDAPGVPVPPERMRVLASSPSGSTFLRSVPLAKFQWGLEEQRVNWNPAVLAKRIPLIALSIQNILTFLKFVNGVPKEELFLGVFDQDAVVDALTDDNRSSDFRFRLRSVMSIENIPRFSKEQILKDYLRDSDQ